MKLKLDELKKAVQWIEANTNALEVRVNTDSQGISFTVFDRNDREVVIYMYNEGLMGAKIRKTEGL